MKFNDFLNESSLSRVYRQALKHATGTITAYRSARDCNTGKPFTKKENQKRNEILAAKLLRKGYGITKVKGTFIEGFGSKKPVEVKEAAFIVVDLKDSGTLRKDLIKLGEQFEQDSITFSEASQSKGQTPYLLIATNNCPNGYPSGGVGSTLKLGKPIFGKDGEFFSRVNGRPFVFEAITDPLHSFSTLSIGSKQAVAILAEQKIASSSCGI